ncbi:hypothetical protein [Dickeya fangzhongdai]|uniref:hypothetical protein n=1 Tax=Dickeya fangzhongdai TaxID=1778540 RepID=UPI003F5D27DC
MNRPETGENGETGVARAAEFCFSNLFCPMLMLQAWNPYFLTFNAPLVSFDAILLLFTVPVAGAAALLGSRHPRLWLIAYDVCAVPAADMGDLASIIARRPPPTCCNAALLRLPEFL